jgi:hypothetical protein
MKMELEQLVVTSRLAPWSSLASALAPPRAVRLPPSRRHCSSIPPPPGRTILHRSRLEELDHQLAVVVMSRVVAELTPTAVVWAGPPPRTA